MQLNPPKNFITKFLLVTLLAGFLNLSVNTANADFKDVKETTKNKEAILYLQEHGIIKGYDNGTFKPKKAVNRAEFLKIIIEGSLIPLDINDEAPFPDIDYGEWYATYVQKAFAEGWINGYPDGTFKPDQTINKVEALKILGKAQNWPIESIDPQDYYNLFEDIDPSQWYAPYIAYARQNQYLEETGSFFSPEALMRRGSISEIIYRTLISEETTDTVSDTDIDVSDSTEITKPDPTTEAEQELEPKIEPEPQPQPEPETSFTPVGYNVIAANSYDNIQLSESIPNTFYKNEVYILRGDITSGTQEKATVILDNDDKTIHKAFVGSAINNHFEIPIYFTRSGNYYLGLIPGESGQSKAYEISVLTNIPQSLNTAASLPDPATSLNISFANDQTSINFNTATNTLKKITFTQSNNSVTYLYRQDTNSIPVQYGDFAKFGAGQVTYFIDTAYLQSQKPLEISSVFASSQDETFTAAEHSFDDIKKDEITTTVADTMNAPGNILITGTVKTDMKNKALVIKPDGFMDEVILTTTSGTETYFGQTLIKNGGNFTFNYTPKTGGRYIIEINNKNSEPSLNHPIYIGNVIPLIPDFFDLNQRELFEITLDLNQERQNMLKLINQSRSEHGLQPIVLADELNNLAQAHSDDMVKNNYFSHYNLQNQTPDDRRIAMGIKTSVGENLAKDVSVAFAHYGFMRSASHRQNILTPEWTRIGLGITLSEGHLVIAQEFSGNEITTNDLTNYKTELFNGINNKRSSNNTASITLNSSIDNAGKSLNDKIIDQGSTLTNSDFTNALEGNNIQGSSQLVGRTGNPWKTLLDSIINEETSLFESAWKLIGIDIQTDSIGKIHILVIINDND